METRDDDVADLTETVIEHRPRRVHGSRRIGPDPIFPEVPRAFNLRPSLDDLPEEQALTIEINGRPVASLLCSPSGATELAVGWAFGQGFFDDPKQLQRFTSYRDRVALMVDRAGTGGAIWRDVVASGFDASTVRTCRSLSTVQKLDDEEPDANVAGAGLDRSRFLTMVERVFERFHGDHGGGYFQHAGVTDGHQVCAVSRDVSRHNALDKLVGWSIAQQVDRSRLVLCLSGRVNADIAFKAARAGFPILASSSLPTCEAVELAHAARMTLVARVLDGERAIYAHAWRLTSEDDES